MINYEENQQITLTARKLSKAYPTEAAYGSRASLWNRGVADGLVTRDVYDKAKIFYGRLWDYVGD